MVGLRATREALDAAVAAPVWPLGETEVVEAVELVLAAESVLAAVRSHLVHEADDQGLRSQTQAPTTERWLTQRFRLSRATANAYVREADLMAAEPAAAAALANAVCTPEQARVIATTLRDLPEVPPDVRAAAAGLLVEQAQALDPAALARAGRHLHETLTSTPDVDDPAEAAALDADARRAADRLHALRSLTWRRHLDGSVGGRFRLDALAGETLLTAINALTARRDQVHGVDSGEPALLTEPVIADERTTPQRRADALASLAGMALDWGQLPTRGGIRPTLVVTTTLDALQGRVAATGLLPLGGSIDPAGLRRIACDADVIPAVLDGAGHVLDLGRTRRLFSPAQRRALALRDRGCVHPGCAAPPAASEAHHLTAGTTAARPT